MTEVAELARLVNMRPTNRRYDWARAASALGVMPPPDYVELIDTYGGGVLNKDVHLFEPGCHLPAYDLLDEGLLRAEDAEEFWEEELEGFAKPARLQTPGTRLIAWAGTPEAEYLYWVVNPSQPSRTWPVAVEHAVNHTWEFHNLGTVDFLYAVLTRAVDTQSLGGLADLTPYSYTNY